MKPDYKVATGALIPPTACGGCGKLNQGTNYCGWDCQIAAAKAAGGIVRTPNGLPIRSIRFDGTMLEHEHGDHPNYKYPVDVEYIGQDDSRFYWAVGGGPNGETTEYVPFTPEERERASKETHALIYTDGIVALTLSEDCYAVWNLHDGKVIGGNLWDRNKWQLTPESLKKIQGPTKEEKIAILDEFRYELYLNDPDPDVCFFCGGQLNPNLKCVAACCKEST